MRKTVLAVVAMALCATTAQAGTISGKVTDESGNAMEGVMVSAFDEERQVSTSVFSQADGTYRIDGLRDAEFNVRARLLGQLDAWEEEIESGETGLDFEMEVATGEDLEMQRPGNSAFAQLPFDSHADKMNFKMMCMYCHQVGTVGWRTPEEPVDWETMIRRMDGYGGLNAHNKETIVEKIVSNFSDEAVAKWPTYEPPPAPTGAATRARITEWDMGEKRKVTIHDIEPGKDGLVYGVDMSHNAVISLNPETGERLEYPFPGKYRGPHSIEPDNDGNMWFTLCASGEMAKFDINTKEITIASSAESPAPRGGYPHTLRVNPKDPESLVWYTDAATNSCFSIHPKTMKVKEYKLLGADQVQGGGRGESRGITPYGIDYSPKDGSIWASKLNGNRLVRIDPKTGEVKEWDPPFRGPRRHHVAPDGLVWVPGFGSGQFGSFNPETEEWKVYDLPDKDNQIPYALNIHPQTGNVWICGTGTDVLWSFDPKTEDLVEYRMPSRVTYTREIEFTDDGAVWTCNSNGPARHTERQFGSIIKLEVLDENLEVAAK